MFDIKTDRDLIINVAKYKGFVYNKTYTSSNGRVTELNDDYIFIKIVNNNYLITTISCRSYFKINDSDIIEYIRNEKIKELLYEE